MAYRRRRPRIGTTGCLFWLFILLVIVVIFLYRGKGNLKESFSFLKKLRKEKQEEVVREKKPEVKGEETSSKPSELKDVEKQKPVMPGASPQGSPRQEISKKPGAVSKGTTGGAGTGEAGAPGGAASPSGDGTAAERPKPGPETSQAKKGEIRAKTLAASLYFVKIDGENGSVKPVPVERTIEYKDSPITKTIESLLRGPTEAERNKGIISLIPEGTRLLAARIDEGHLTLNFSHHFEENYTGREAILLELSQVILTSFDFNQVSKVSIRIEGKLKRYITGEGIPLKEAYTKQDLSSLVPEG